MNPVTDEDSAPHSGEPEHVSDAQPGAPADIDRHIGRRIREGRKRRGMSQQRLGNLVGITYQQTHKYERGLSRVPAARLHAFARALQLPTSWFFEGLDEASSGPEAPDGRQRIAEEMSRSFAAIRDDETRAALSLLARLLADAQRGDGGA